MFKDDRERVVDEPRSGRLTKSEENVTHMQNLLNKDRRLSVQMIAGTLKLRKTIVYEVVSETLQLRKGPDQEQLGNNTAASIQSGPCPG